MTNGEAPVFTPPPPPPEGDKAPEPRWLFYILSFVIPLAGIILGAIYLSKSSPDCKKFGKTCLILALSAIGVCCLCYVLYLLGIVGFGFLSTILSAVS